MQCRNNGYFDVSNIEEALLEPNGKISFLPISTQRPITPQDLNLDVPKDAFVVNVIVDGVIMKENLKYTGNEEKWLKKQLDKKGISKVEDVFLAMCDYYNNFKAYLKKEPKTK